MVNFIKNTVFALIIISIGLIVIPNPIRYRIPELLKKYIDFKTISRQELFDLNQLELAQQDPTVCQQNSDCTLILCGKAPNCHSIAINTTNRENVANLPNTFACPENLDSFPACKPEFYWDAIAACKQGQCVMERLLHPSPTPHIYLFDVDHK